jgi:hypothetical protein
MMYLYPQKVISKEKQRKKLFFVAVLKVTDEKSRIVSQRYGSVDPDPYQNVMDPEHCYESTGK